MSVNPEDVALPELDAHYKGLSATAAAAMLSNFLCSMIAWDYIPQHHLLQARELAALGRRAANSGPDFPAMADSV